MLAHWHTKKSPTLLHRQTTSAQCVSQGVWRSLGLRLFIFFSVKKRDTGVPVCQPGDDLRRWCWKPAQTNFQAI